MHLKDEDYSSQPRCKNLDDKMHTLILTTHENLVTCPNCLEVMSWTRVVEDDDDGDEGLSYG